MYYRSKKKNLKGTKKTCDGRNVDNHQINTNSCSNKAFKRTLTEYISTGKGFSAVVKQRPFDFQVYEIGMDGKAVHLTETLTEEYGKKLQFLDLVGKRLNPYKLTQFVLYKESMTTREALLKIGLLSNLDATKKCMTSEAIDRNQDRRAITSQLVTVWNENFDAEKLCSELKCVSNVAVGNFRLINKPLKQGHLRGNRFIMALRNVVGNKCDIVANLESLKNMGFINYYGTESSVRAPIHLIGKHLLLQEWQKALHSLSHISVAVLSSDVPVGFKKLRNATLAQLFYTKLTHKGSREDIKIFKNSLRSRWKEETHEFATILNSFYQKRTSQQITIETIPAKIRLFCIIAYQRFYWNTIVSKRLAKFGLEPIIGDLVYASSASVRDEKYEDDRVESDNESSNYTESEDDSKHNQRKVIFIDENNIRNYTIHDVILPLPGCNVTYPANEVANWYEDLFLADGLSQNDFERSSKDFADENLASSNFVATYRPLVLKPLDVKWRFESYCNPALSLIPSDLDRLKNTHKYRTTNKGDTHLALVLELSLPTSAYVSMALREITKMNMSGPFYTSLSNLLAEMATKETACWDKANVEFTQNKEMLDQNRKRSLPTTKFPKETELKRMKLKSGTEPASRDMESAKEPRITALKEVPHISNTNSLVGNYSQEQIELKSEKVDINSSQALPQDTDSSKDIEVKQIEKKPSCSKGSAPIASRSFVRPTIFRVERIKEEPGTSPERRAEPSKPSKPSESKQITFVDLTSD